MAAAVAARGAQAASRCCGPARAPAAPAAAAAAARRRPTPPPRPACRFVSDKRPSQGSPAPPHGGATPPTTLEEALSRLAEARLAASEAVERLARLASDPDEAVAELVSRLASSPRILGGADVRQRRSRAASRKSRSPGGSRSASSSRLPSGSLPPIVVVEAPATQEQQQRQ
jgi:hypothetical protein